MRQLGETSTVASREATSKYPEFVYFNLPSRYAALALTTPNKHANLHCNAEVQPLIDGLSVKMRNNKVWAVKPQLENISLLEDVSYFLPKGIYEILTKLAKLNELSRGEFVEFIIRLVSDDIQQDVSRVIRQQEQEEGEVYVNDYDAQMEIEGFYYEGVYVPFEEKEKLREKAEQNMSIFKLLSHIEKGDYLYRAVDSTEWESILKNEIFFIRNNTNFEDKVGPQVKDYAQDLSYAAKIIRIKVAGPYFRNAGMQVPRVESITAHFAEVEVLVNDEWISIREYKRRA